MPGGDGTGPAGMGPMTGRGAGFCAGYTVPGYMNPVVRGGWGFGRRGGWGGWGRRNWFYATGLPGWQRGYGYPNTGAFPAGIPNAAPYGTFFTQGAKKEDELSALKGQAEYLEDALGGIQNRIAELEKETKEK